jgi:hypothetical protein
MRTISLTPIVHGIAAWLIAMSMASRAHATPGDGFGAGPVFGIAKDGTFSLGWEVSATTFLPLLKASLGGNYALNATAAQPVAIHYLAFEPWLVIGGTLGAAIADTGEVDFMHGIWEGAPIALNETLVPDRGTVHPKWAWLLTLTVGCRIFGSGSPQFYFAPKLWRYDVYEWDG